MVALWKGRKNCGHLWPISRLAHLEETSPTLLVFRKLLKVRVLAHIAQPLLALQLTRQVFTLTERLFQHNDTIVSGPTGEPMPIEWGSVYDFVPNPTLTDFENYTEAHDLVKSFASNYTELLVALHNVFNGSPSSYFNTLAAMHDLTTWAEALLQTPDPRNASFAIGPVWEFVPSASHHAIREGRARPTMPLGTRV